MELLKFLSFGSWSTIVNQDDCRIITVFFIMSCVFLLLKTMVNIGEYTDELKSSNKNVLTYLIALVIMFLYSSLHLVPFVLAALTSSIVAMYFASVIVTVFLFVPGVHYVISEGVSLFPFDKKVRRLVRINILEPLANSLTAKKEIKKINKRIYEYRKTSI